MLDPFCRTGGFIVSRRIFSRRSFFGLLGAAPLAVPAVVRAATEPVAAGADVQADRIPLCQ